MSRTGQDAAVEQATKVAGVALTTGTIVTPVPP